VKILIADDDATNRVLLGAALKKLGYEVETTTNGDEAWAALQRLDAAELAILDWMMPGMTGPEICLKLRARDDGRYVYVILLTGLTDLSALVEGLESGADDFIAKPFRTPELYARLRAGQRLLDLQRELLAGRAQIEHFAAHDSLTGLWNRRVILEQLAQELARAQRELKPVGVIMMDIDHFKQINDSYGHPKGDQVLQETAKRLTETVRPYDSVGRYGGEEFLLLAGNCSMEQTFAVAERLRSAIGAEPMKIDSALLRVTASFGVSSAKAGEMGDGKMLIEAADRALYRAKELGRNRVECSSDDANTSSARVMPVATWQ
jgi:diguanylate cyclase (GGDEF)-like protein